MTREWLSTFLECRGLEEPDQRLLWRYECRDDEYQSLVGALERVGDPRHLRRTFSYGVPLEEQPPSAEDERLTMPAFVLYGSEWFRREWETGKTRGVWSRLMHRLGWSANEYWELYPAMASGLAWWNHSFVQIIKTQYLGTLGYQGGVVQVTGIQD